MATTIIEPPHLGADLKTLYLSTIAEQWRPLAEQAVRQRQGPADYLAELVHLEVTGRRERRIQRRIHDARFPMLKTLCSASTTFADRRQLFLPVCASRHARSPWATRQPQVPVKRHSKLTPWRHRN